MHQNCGVGNFFEVADTLRIYHLHYWTYVFTGFWKYESVKQWKTNLFRIYQSVLTFFYFVTVVSFFVDAVSVRHDLDKLSFNLSSSVLVFVTVTKISMLRSRKSSLESVLNNLENNLNLKTVGRSKDDGEIFKKRAELIMNMTKMLYGLLVVCYSLRVSADTALDTRAYLIPLPYKEKLDDHYEIIYTQQVIITTHFLVTVIAHDLLIYGIINRLIAHFEVLEKNFLRIKTLYSGLDLERYVRGCAGGAIKQRKIIAEALIPRASLNDTADIYKMYKHNAISEAEVKEKTKQLLRESIHHHQKLLKEITSFAKIYSQPLTVQACGAVLLIGIVAIKILFLSSQITPLLVQQVMYVGITLINILYLCSFGSELTSKSMEAGNALYDTPWYDMEVKSKKIVSFALRKLMAGPKLKGGSWITINRVTYLKFLKTSYNMVVVLRNVYSEL